MRAQERLRLWRVCWFDTKRVVLYWLEKAAERIYAPGGAGRKRDRDAFEQDMRL